MEGANRPAVEGRRNLPAAIRAAARAILDDVGPSGIGIREAARRAGVSPTAVYRYFPSKEDLLASIADEGFRELAAAMKADVCERPDGGGIGLAYVDFALQHRGLFRLMFGSLLADRAGRPALAESVNAACAFLEQVVTGGRTRTDGGTAAPLVATWGLLHGLSTLSLDGILPESLARVIAGEIVVGSRAVHGRRSPEQAA